MKYWGEKMHNVTTAGRYVRRLASSVAVGAVALSAFVAPASASSPTADVRMTAPAISVASTTTSAAALPDVVLNPNQCHPGTVDDGISVFRYTTTQYGVRYYRYSQHYGDGTEGSASCSVSEYRFATGQKYDIGQCLINGAVVALGTRFGGGTVRAVFASGTTSCVVSYL